jgi:pyrrolidone-carboxylate peptidase
MADPQRTLVTGYGPFGDIKENPSAKLAEGCGRPFRILEVAFEAADDFLANLDPSTFDRLLMIGVAAGRKHVTPEVYGRNQIGRVKDVQGIERFGPIDPKGDLLLLSTLWTPEVLGDLLLDPRLHASFDAGSYLCNFVTYRALSRFPEKAVGFLHVPKPEDMPLDIQAEVLQKVLAQLERG